MLFPYCCLPKKNNNNKIKSFCIDHIILPSHGGPLSLSLNILFSKLCAFVAKEKEFG